MSKLHQTVQIIESREVAEMINKRHDSLLRDIRGYISYMENNENSDCKTASGTARNFAVSDFFYESAYTDSTGRSLPCYLITQKGCEFIANKMTGRKGTLFTAAYVTRFHKMKTTLTLPQKTASPPPCGVHNYPIKYYKGNPVILVADFEAITGLNMEKQKLFFRQEYFTAGKDFNGAAWTNWGAEYDAGYWSDGPPRTIVFMYRSGVEIAIKLLNLPQNISKYLLSLVPSQKPPHKPQKSNQYTISGTITISPQVP